MSRRRALYLSLLVASAFFLILNVDAKAQQSKLGTVSFPNSGSEKAQEHFIRGLAALHSFWFEEALDEFRESTKIDTEFAMGYWGEAMSYNHPLWAEQDLDNGRKAIAKVKDSFKMTSRERAFVDAVRVLYGEGDKLARDKAYCAAMERVYRSYPDDLEAACFYSLSLLGTVRPGDKGYRRQAQAGAIALDVYQKNPNHPGAAHYIIHAFDDPEHAIIALPAARRYAEIAPEAHHARHMPAHIFLQLGMWPEAAASNESAWSVSDAWVKRKNLPISARDYHSLHWLEYVYLQQGRVAKASELMRIKRTDVEQSKGDAGVTRYNEDMAAAFVIETEQWNLVATLFPSTQPSQSDGGVTHAAHNQPPAMSGRTRRGETLAPFLRGMAAAKSGAEAAQSIAELETIRKRLADAGDAYPAKSAEILALEVSAVAASSRNDHQTAIDLMSKAAAIEEEMSPPSGPPTLIKPSNELYGEILLAAGRPKDAVKQFEKSLLRQPNRARSILGVARAAAKAGDTKQAAEAYSKLVRQWNQGDAGLPELREAQDYLKQARAN